MLFPVWSDKVTLLHHIMLFADSIKLIMVIGCHCTIYYPVTLAKSRGQR